ncbi:MAG: hypothetical protein IKR04_02335 [Clostridia bacterium]|nr:hypothetical protein [Clostridia bacterium]
MANILEEIIEELNEYVLSGKFGVDEIYGDLIRRLFRSSDDVRNYLFYELESEARTKYDLHKDTPTETYLWNITDSIWSMYDAWYRAGEVDIGDNFDVDANGTITFSVTTLTCCAEPDVNYYDDGLDSVKGFVEELKDKIQAKSIKIEEDWDFDEHSGNPTSSHRIIVKMWGE